MPCAVYEQFILCLYFFKFSSIRNVDLKVANNALNTQLSLHILFSLNPAFHQCRYYCLPLNLEIFEIADFLSSFNGTKKTTNLSKKRNGKLYASIDAFYISVFFTFFTLHILHIVYELQFHLKRNRI